MTENRTRTGLRATDRGLIQHAALKEALDQAIVNDIDLTGIDLSRQDLRGINLDGISLRNANFTDCDLSGANMSEANFTRCIFSEARLFDTCFAYSTLDDCRFENTKFGVTDFSEAQLLSCIFSGMSVFTLDLQNSATLKNSVFINENEHLAMSIPPYVVRGFKSSVIFLDDKILIDGNSYDFERNALTDFADRFLLQLLSRNSFTGCNIFQNSTKN